MFVLYPVTRLAFDKHWSSKAGRLIWYFSRQSGYYNYKFCFLMIAAYCRQQGFYLCTAVGGSFPPADGTSTAAIVPTALQDRAGQERFAAQSSELRLCFLVSFQSFYSDFNGGKASTTRLNKKCHYVISRASFISVIFAFWRLDHRCWKIWPADKMNSKHRTK